MIARIWHSMTKLTDAENYQEYLNRHVVPNYQTAEGYRGLYIMKECQGELMHFLLLTLWASDETLEKYTGTANDVVNPVPEERDLLVAFESTARRYRVIKSTA